MPNKSIVGYLLAASMLLFTSSSAFSRDCGKLDILLSTTPSPPQSRYYWQRHEFLAGLLSSKQVKLMVVGDSLAKNWPNEAYLFNYGVGADRTQHVLWRLLDERGRLLDPKNIVIIAGTNNLGNGEAICGVVAGIEAILRRSLELWPSANIILMQLLPRYDAGFDARKEEDRKAINREISDMHGAVSLNSDELLGCREGAPCGAYLLDRLHLNPDGYKILERLIAPHLR